MQLLHYFLSAYLVFWTALTNIFTLDCQKVPLYLIHKLMKTHFYNFVWILKSVPYWSDTSHIACKLVVPICASVPEVPDV
ncbi:hypothetical protein EK904_007799 [Melospiza melodia maxima]|nr:hypothetical protein EK904_007799 [Melospiza melodia maxima]